MTTPREMLEAVSVVRDVLCEALSWGATYGPIIPGHQWDAMRDRMVDQFAERLFAAARSTKSEDETS